MRQLITHYSQRPELRLRPVQVGAVVVRATVGENFVERLLALGLQITEEQQQIPSGEGTRRPEILKWEPNNPSDLVTLRELPNILDQMRRRLATVKLKRFIGSSPTTPTYFVLYTGFELPGSRARPFVALPELEPVFGACYAGLACYRAPRESQLFIKADHPTARAAGRVYHVGVRPDGSPYIGRNGG